MGLEYDEIDDKRAVLEQEMRSCLHHQMNLDSRSGSGDICKDRLAWIWRAEAVCKRVEDLITDFEFRIQDIANYHEDFAELLEAIHTKHKENTRQVKREQIKACKEYLHFYKFYEKLQALRSQSHVDHPTSIESALTVHERFKSNWRIAEDLHRVLQKGTPYYINVYFESQNPPTTLKEQTEAIDCAGYLPRKHELDIDCATVIRSELCRLGALLGLCSAAAYKPRNEKCFCEMLIDHELYLDSLKQHKQLLIKLENYTNKQFSSFSSEVRTLKECISQQKERTTQLQNDKQAQFEALYGIRRRVASTQVLLPRLHVSVDVIHDMYVDIYQDFQFVFQVLRGMSHDMEMKRMVIVARKLDECTQQIELRFETFKKAAAQSAYGHDKEETVKKWRRILHTLCRVQCSHVIRRVAAIDRAVNVYHQTEKQPLVKLRYFAHPGELDVREKSEGESLDALNTHVTTIEDMKPLSELSLFKPEVKKQLEPLEGRINQSIQYLEQQLRDIECLQHTVKFLQYHMYRVKFYCEGNYDHHLLLANLCQRTIGAKGYKAMQKLANKTNSIVHVLNIKNRKADMPPISPEFSVDGTEPRPITLATDGKYSFVLEPEVGNVTLPGATPTMEATLHQFQAPFVSQDTAAELLPLHCTFISVINTHFSASLDVSKPADKQSSVESLKALNELPDTLYLAFQNLRHKELDKIIEEVGMSGEVLREFVLYIATHGRQNELLDITGDTIPLAALKTHVTQSIKAENYYIVPEVCRLSEIESTSNSDGSDDVSKCQVLLLSDADARCYLTKIKHYLRFPIELNRIRECMQRKGRRRDGVIWLIKKAASQVLEQNRSIKMTFPVDKTAAEGLELNRYIGSSDP